MSAAPHILTRTTHRATRAGGNQRLMGDLTLAPARVHEFCGTARHTLAMTLARAMQGPVLWLQPGWMPEALNPDGVCRFIDPGRLIFARPRRPEDVLWSMEEALRSGAVPLVVADLPAPPALTPVRRLHLAAETGAAEGETVPLGVLLTPEAGGAPGVETRWDLQSAHGLDRRWRLHRRRARTAPEASWPVVAGASGLTLAEG